MISLPPPSLVWKDVPAVVSQSTKLCPVVQVKAGNTTVGRQLLTVKVAKSANGTFVPQYACLTQQQYIIEQQNAAQRALHQEYDKEQTYGF